MSPRIRRPSKARSARPKSRRASSRRASPRRAAVAKSQEGPQRLQKVLAAAGFGSRRECETLIVAGRVEIDREYVVELGVKVDPKSQEIRVDGQSLRQPKLVYYMLHKPPKVVATAKDPAGRPRVVDLAPREPRVFPVGRLDMASEGLILLTNDGDLANGLTHPRFGIEKTYLVRVAGGVTHEEVDRIRRGVRLADGMARVARMRIKSKDKKSTWLEMVLDEGRNREIRRLLAAVGHKVLQLRRVAMGPVRLGDLPSGAYRPLRKEEVRKLRDAVQEGRAQPSRRPARVKHAAKSSQTDTAAATSPLTPAAKKKTSTSAREAKEEKSPSFQRGKKKVSSRKPSAVGESQGQRKKPASAAKPTSTSFRAAENKTSTSFRAGKKKTNSRKPSVVSKSRGQRKKPAGAAGSRRKSSR